MKKISGKALSIVLSLALVVSSFSATSAFASTQSMSGIVNDQVNDDLYLVNGGGREVDLNNWLVTSDTLETPNRKEVDSPKVSAISHVSGDSLVSLSISGTDDDTATLKLKSATKDGTEVISVLYKGTYDDDNGNEYTVKARKNVTVHVFDKDAVVFGKAASSITAGDGPDDVVSFAETRNTTEDMGVYLAEPQGDDDTSTNAALATYQPVYLTTKDSNITAPTNSTAYSVEITSGDDNVDFTSAVKTALDTTTPVAFSSSNPLTFVSGKSSSYSGGIYSKDAAPCNVTVTFKKVVDGKASSDSSDKYTLKTKVDKKVNVEQALKNASAASKAYTGTEYSVVKADGKTRIENLYDATLASSSDTQIDVTDAIIDFPAGTTKVTVDDNTNVKEIIGTVGSSASKGLVIGDARVGSVDVDDGDVELSDGKVGDITTGEADSSTTGNVTINSGSTGDIDTSNTAVEADVTLNGGTVGNVTTTSNGSIDIDTNDEDTPVVASTLKSKDMTIYGDEAAITVSDIVAKADGTITLKGDNVTVKALDMDGRSSTLALGDDDNEFTGTIPAPTNAENMTLSTDNSDTAATITGNINLDTISLGSDTSVTFAGNITVDTVDGDGFMTIKAGSLYVSGSVSSTKLKLSDASIATGTTVFKAASDAVDTNDFDCYGFTVAKTSGTNIDTFKIDTLTFAGIAMNKASDTIVNGESATYTVSAYPGGTSIPSGYTVGWELDGGSSDVFSMTSTGNTATVTVNSIDPTFASENKTTLTATLYDADGYEVDTDTYGDATCDITAVATPTVNYTSDTTGTVNMTVGGTYQFKITSTDGSVPSFVVAGNGGAAVTATSKSGNDYFYKVTALKAGDYGVYVSGTTRTAVLHITGASVSIDTSAVTVKVGGTYQFKVTSATKPTFGLGSGNVQVIASSNSGSDYFFKVKAAAGKTGDKVGVYVNGVRMAIVTIG